MYSSRHLPVPPKVWALSLSACLLMPTLIAAELPKGWMLGGRKVSHYQAALDTRTTLSGHGAGTLWNNQDRGEGFGSLLTAFDPADYAGKRVRLSGWLRYRNVTGWTGLWMRADSPDKFGSAFYNSQDLHLHGSRDWTEYSVVLDIPAQAERLTYGVLLDGQGQVWLDRMRFEVVDEQVPVSVQAPGEGEKMSRQPALFQ
ncbi:hypothetical protein [Chitinimonas naiadis]